MSLILQLLGLKVDPSKIRRVGSSKGGEYHSPCPLCGGDDRFLTFPDQEGGETCRRHGLLGTWSCPRHCGIGGDLIDWYMKIEGMSYKEACTALGIVSGDIRRTPSYRPINPPSQSSQDVHVPHYAPPPDSWVTSATKFALDAHNAILGAPGALAWLARRGIPSEAVKAYGLGFIEASDSAPYVFRDRAAFGLPPKTHDDGRLVRAFRIPRGITIPAWSDDGRYCYRIRIRRPDKDIDKGNPKDPKYLLIPQPPKAYSAPLCLAPHNADPELATWVIVESELDAIAVHHACQGKVGVISILSVRVKPDDVCHQALIQSPRILVALDFDQDKADGSNPGADAWPWWKERYPQARLWPVPIGKDPGEAFALGVNLQQWILAAGSRARSVQAKPAPKKAQTRSPSNNGFICWPVPDSVQSFTDLMLPQNVTHRDLLNSMRKAYIDDKECIVPCPKTSPTWWWKYYKNCSRCYGHKECIVGVIKSDIFKKALDKYKEASL